MMKKYKTYVKNVLLIIGSILGILWGFLSVVAFCASRWVMKTWGLLTIDEILFHLQSPLEGTNVEVIEDFIQYCIPASILYVILLIVLLTGFRKQHLKCVFVLVGNFICSLFLLGSAGKYLYDELDIKGYIEDQKNPSTFIEDYYADPQEVELVFPEEKRNLIYIFLESMENTYASIEDGGAYRENYIPELTQLAEENYSFSNNEMLGGAYVMPGATWTMGATFAQTSGMPLKTPAGTNGMDQAEQFLPDITTLGDILEKEEYHQVYMVGSNAIFGGRYNYFTQHGDYEIFDLFTARETGKIPEDYMEFWGYEDEKLFTYAKEKLEYLSAEENPFNLTLLTVDTHFEDGYVCEFCGDEYDDQYANVISCSSKMVKEFVEWVQEQSFYENTTIVLVGDHLTMDSDFCDEVDEEYERTVYNAIINPAVGTKNLKNRIFTTMDLFPTTLASMGVEIEGDRLALGTNLFSGEKTLGERVGIEKMSKELERKSEFMEKFTDYMLED